MTAPAECPRHEPHQHRDARPPWCDLCGRDAAGNAPQSTLRPAGPRPLPPVGTRVAWQDTVDNVNWRHLAGIVMAHEDRVLVVSDGDEVHRVQANNVHVQPAVT